MSLANIDTRKTILLTGATGYLGSNLLQALLARSDYRVIVLKRSFSNTFRISNCLDYVTAYNLDEVELESVFRDNQVDLILHCATDYGRKNVNPLQVVEANLILPLKLMEIGIKYGVKGFINTDTILDKRINHYSLSKKQFKDWLISYRNELICINVVSEHFYGPGDDKTKFVSFVIDSYLRRVAKIELTLGEQKRDFIYIDDMVDAFIKIIDYAFTLSNGFYEFQTGSEQVTTVKDLVQMIGTILDNKITYPDFGALPYRENEVMECVADTTELKKLGWQPQNSLLAGLQKTIKQELNNLTEQL